MVCLVTGAAGFIGYHMCQRLLHEGHQVYGLDNLNAYYSVDLKQKRLARLERHPGFKFFKTDLADQAGVEAVFSHAPITQIIHLGAQAGVRYSLENPRAYVQSNLVGFFNVLEAARAAKVQHFVFASTSSVYGSNQQMPFSTSHLTDHPVSFYAATKKSNEVLAHSYASMHGLPVTGLRFFTVYGPWGRPDMALWLFTQAILNKQPITLYDEGQLKRDFTYIDDIIEAMWRVLQKPPLANPAYDYLRPDPATSDAPYAVFNIGNHQPVRVKDLVVLLEEALGQKAHIRFAPLQTGDVRATFADIDPLTQRTGFTPQTPLAVGVKNFVAWYKEFYAQ